MTAADATRQAIRLLPDHTVICQERYQSTHHQPAVRTLETECQISVHPSIEGRAACQQFRAGSFDGCLEQLIATIATCVVP